MYLHHYDLTEKLVYSPNVSNRPQTFSIVDAIIKVGSNLYSFYVESKTETWVQERGDTVKVKFECEGKVSIGELYVPFDLSVTYVHNEFSNTLTIDKSQVTPKCTGEQLRLLSLGGDFGFDVIHVSLVALRMFPNATPPIETIIAISSSYIGYQKNKGVEIEVDKLGLPNPLKDLPVFKFLPSECTYRSKGLPHPSLPKLNPIHEILKDIEKEPFSFETVPVLETTLNPGEQLLNRIKEVGREMIESSEYEMGVSNGKVTDFLEQEREKQKIERDDNLVTYVGTPRKPDPVLARIEDVLKHNEEEIEIESNGWIPKPTVSTQNLFVNEFVRLRITSIDVNELYRTFDVRDPNYHKEVNFKWSDLVVKKMLIYIEDHGTKEIEFDKESIGVVPTPDGYVFGTHACFDVIISKEEMKYIKPPFSLVRFVIQLAGSVNHNNELIINSIVIKSNGQPDWFVDWFKARFPILPIGVMFSVPKINK